MPNTVLVEKKPEVESKAKEVTVSSYWLTLGEMRLDASFYAENSRRALRILKESGYEIGSLVTLSTNIFNPPPIKRQYSSKEGTAYLMPRELFSLRLEPTKFVFTSKMTNIQDWFVKENWIILTQSGKVGIPLYVTKRLERFVVSQNAIRIILKDDVYSGFIYAWLSTWLGQALITKDQFGVTVEHLRPHHIESVSVPSLPKNIEKQIHENITKAYELLDEARELLDKAEQQLYQELNIQDSYSPTNRGFTVRSTELDLRFDASYHIPLVKHLQSQLSKCKYPVERIKNNLAKVFIPGRFKRIFVEKHYGIQYLLPTHIVQIRPSEQKYISKKATSNIDEYILQKGWVLVTTDGTVGRTTIVGSELVGWFGSNNIARVIVNDEKLCPSYLAVFLMSKLGQSQLLRGIYGGVVDHIEKEHIEDVFVPIPPLDVQRKIGDLALKAFELKHLSNRIEDETVRTLENMLEKHRKVEINEEYLKEINSYADSFELIGNEEFRKSREELECGETISFDEFKKEHGF